MGMVGVASLPTGLTRCMKHLSIVNFLSSTQGQFHNPAVPVSVDGGPYNKTNIRFKVCRSQMQILGPAQKYFCKQRKNSVPYNAVNALQCTRDCSTTTTTKYLKLSFPWSLNLSSNYNQQHRLPELLCPRNNLNLLHLSPLCSSSTEHTNHVRGDIITLIETDGYLEIFLTQLQNSLNFDSSSKTYATSLQNLKPLVRKLVALDCDSRNIHAMLRASPGILPVNSERLMGNIDFLCDLGLNWRRLLKVLDQNSRVWTAPIQHLQNRISLLRKLGFVEGPLQKVIAEWPEILTVRSTKIKSVVRVLMENCKFSKADVVTILSDSPAIITEDVESIEVQFQYIYFRMGILENSEMTQAKVFKYSLDHIRCRHLILERLGLYSAPDNRGRFATRNPKLARIIDSSDARFAEKVAKISPRECDVFAQILVQEMDLEKEMIEKDSSSDSEGLSDDDSDREYEEESADKSDEDVWKDEAEPFDFERVDFRKER